MTTFSELNLAEPLMRALAAEGYDTPTPIQAQAIPGVMTGADLLGIAQTGTGKTAAFALPIMHRLLANKRPALRKGCRVLVLSPTRELASQIAESFRTYGRYTGLTVTTVFGGVGHRPQVQALARGVDILVATPGRLIDHMEARDCDLSGTEIFVLDEADQMLDLGFVKPIRRIVAKVPTKRQSLFFSATMPPEIGRLADELLREPLRVSVTPQAKTVDRITQKVIFVDTQSKRTVLGELLRDPAIQRALVFTRTKRGADRVAQHLETLHINAAAIHGNKSQRQREKALEAFKSGEVRVLVATDIAARGIDIDQVTHVINFELPDVPEAYVHRIGRTARAGASGIAISLCDGEERGQLRDIERTIRLTLPTEDRRSPGSRSEPAASTGERRPDRFNGGARGGRSSSDRIGHANTHAARPPRTGDRGGPRPEQRRAGPSGQGRAGGTGSASTTRTAGRARFRDLVRALDPQ